MNAGDGIFSSSFFFFDASIDAFFPSPLFFCCALCALSRSLSSPMWKQEAELCTDKINIAECLPQENDLNYDEFFLLLLLLLLVSPLTSHVHSKNNGERDAFSSPFLRLYEHRRSSPKKQSLLLHKQKARERKRKTNDGDRSGALWVAWMNLDLSFSLSILSIEQWPVGMRRNVHWCPGQNNDDYLQSLSCGKSPQRPNLSSACMQGLDYWITTVHWNDVFVVIDVQWWMTNRLVETSSFSVHWWRDEIFHQETVLTPHHHLCLHLIHWINSPGWVSCVVFVIICSKFFPRSFSLALAVSVLLNGQKKLFFSLLFFSPSVQMSIGYALQCRRRRSSTRLNTFVCLT